MKRSESGFWAVFISTFITFMVASQNNAISEEWEFSLSESTTIETAAKIDATPLMRFAKIKLSFCTDTNIMIETFNNQLHLMTNVDTDNYKNTIPGECADGTYRPVKIEVNYIGDDGVPNYAELRLVDADWREEGPNHSPRQHAQRDFPFTVGSQELEYMYLPSDFSFKSKLKGKGEIVPFEHNDRSHVLQHSGDADYYELTFTYLYYPDLSKYETPEPEVEAAKDIDE